MKPLVIAGKTFSSRLFVGTGKYPSPEILARALDASGTELVTAALRRIDLEGPDPTISAIDFDRMQLVPNTSGAKDADEAVRKATVDALLGHDVAAVEAIFSAFATADRPPTSYS